MFFFAGFFMFYCIVFRVHMSIVMHKFTKKRMEIFKVRKTLYTMNVTRTLCKHKIRCLSLVLSRLLHNSHFDLHKRSA